MPSAYYLTLSCENRPGIVAAVASQLFQAGGNILEAQQFDDVISSRFFMRVSFDFEHAVDEAVLRGQLNPIASQYAMQWSLRPQSEKQRVLILVSKYDHCLVDLLYRQRIGELPMAVVGVISNHPKELHNPSLLGDIPFHHLPVTPATKSEQERSIRAIIEQRTEAIRHSDMPEALERKGRDIERQVLARAVLNHLENRVLINGAKTVVFGE